MAPNTMLKRSILVCPLLVLAICTGARSDPVTTTENSTDSASTPYPETDWDVHWSTYISGNLADSCTGPAFYYQDQLKLKIRFYSCLEAESSVSLARFFGSTGFNVTYQRLQDQAALDSLQKPYSDLSTAPVSMFKGSSGLKDLLSQAADHAEDLCLNVNAFMGCLDSFLTSCYTDEATPSEEAYYSSSTSSSAETPAESMASSDVTMSSDTMSSSTQAGTQEESTPAGGLEFSAPEPASRSDDNSTGSDSATSNETYSVEQADYSTPHGFFSLPYMVSANAISRMIRAQLQVLCGNANTTSPRPIKDALNALYCHLDDQTANVTCPVADASSPDTRIIDKQYVDCVLANVHDRCSASGADTLHAVVDIYVQEATESSQHTNATDAPPTPPLEY